jgi:alpha-beta hydrolase superfamily lysophospholipase
MHVHHWQPMEAPRAAVQIVHGLAEHGGRYARLAGALTAAGYAVYAPDLPGHGQTAASIQELGFFASAGGWRKCLDDLRLLHRRIVEDHPGLPIVLFAAEQDDVLAGLVLAGSDGKPSFLAQTGRLVARLERLRLGPRGRSAFLQALSFGAFNKPFEPTRTPFDWLSRDSAEVDAYLADPLCGFRPTVQLWIDLLDGWSMIAAGQAHLSKRLPIYVIAGTRDPVSANGRGVERLLSAYRSLGLERVRHRFYTEARHELFHEINHQEVTRDLIAWLDGVVGGSA